MIDEAAELETKLNALTAFLDGEIPESVSAGEVTRMTLQTNHMEGYLQVLKQRISAF